MNKSLSSLLPMEVVVHILEYTNKIKYRNGKFIDQIDENDYRRSLLTNLPKINIIRYKDINQIFCYRRYLHNYILELRSIYIDDLYPETHADDDTLHEQITFYKKRIYTEKSSIRLYNCIMK